jgi:hypothetical protein
MSIQVEGDDAEEVEDEDEDEGEAMHVEKPKKSSRISTKTNLCKE